MARTKVDQTLEPTHRIKFEGSDRIAHVSFSPDGNTAYCLVAAQRIDLWALGRQWWPELLGGALTLLVLAYLLVLLRVLRRPQIRGTPHCRKCNYDVTVQAPASVLPRSERRYPAPGTLCPECGTDLSRKRPRRGRTSARRLLVPSILLAICAAGYIALHAARVPRTGPLNNAPEMWSSWVDDFAEQRQLAAILKHKTHVAQIIRVDTRSGTILGTLRTLRGYPAGDMRVSPDGRFIAVVGNKTTLLWIRTSNGRTVARTSSGDIQRVVELLDSAESLWVYYSAVDQSAAESYLLRWRPSDGVKETVIAETASQATVAVNGTKAYVDNRYAVLRRLDGIATMSAPSFEEAFRRQRYELTVRGPIENGSQVERTIRITEARTSSSPLVMTPDGNTLFLTASIDGIIGFDVRSGQRLGTLKPAPSQIPGYTLAISADGERLFVPVFRHSILIRDITRKRWVAQLNYPEEYYQTRLEASTDGRWLAAFAVRQIGAGETEGALFLYDLTALGKQPAGASSSDSAGEKP